MIKLPYYKKMQNKGNLKKKLMIMIEDLSNSDYDAIAYHVCSNDMFNEPIKTGFHLMTRPPPGNKILESFDIEKYRNLCYTNTLPRTRNFKCLNDKCPTHDVKTPQEAIFFRIPNSFQVYYICTICHTLKIN